MTDNTFTIELTKWQVDTVKWLLGCPLFNEESVASLAWDWDIPEDEASELMAAAKAAKLTGTVLTVPRNAIVLDYMHNYCEQLESMNTNEGFEERLAKGDTHQQARCKMMATNKAVKAVARKLLAAIEEINAANEKH